jgi:hypothetical protein
MLDTYIKNRGMSKTIVHKNNRNIINKTNWDADYDGNVANISLDLSKNGRNKHLDFKFTNNDLANLLSIPSVNQPIHKRLKMDFQKPESSLEDIFLELDPDSDSDSDSSDSSDSDSDSSALDLNNINMNTIFDSNPLSDKPTTQISPIQELLTHISSPKSNEEFIMPFQDYSLDKQPIIKIVHKPKSSKKRSSSRKSSRKNLKVNNHKVRHHNYPATRKSSKRKSSKRRRSSSALSRAISKYI